MKARKWMMEYGVAMILAVVCAVILGPLSLFREATVGKLHATDLVQFIGYGGAMVLAWFGARPLSDEPPDDWKWLVPYRALILPVKTLVVVGLIACGVWLIMTWLQKCASQVASRETRRLRKAA